MSHAKYLRRVADGYEYGHIEETFFKKERKLTYHVSGISPTYQEEILANRMDEGKAPEIARPKWVTLPGQKSF